MNRRLQLYLDEHGIDDLSDPAGLWLRLHGDIGERATLIDRYELEAASRDIGVAELSDEARSCMQMEVLPLLFPGFDRKGASSPIDPIVVVDYDEAWPRRFGLLQDSLAKALEGLDVVIEHLGSTAVPGLAAKPVIDVSVAVSDVEDEKSYLAAVESCGVTLRSSDHGHRYFKPLPPLPRSVQIHVVDRGSDWQRRHLLFRDYLRAHPAAVTAYGALKKSLAHTHRNDRLAYNAAKTDFILDHMAIAETWAHG